MNTVRPNPFPAASTPTRPAAPQADAAKLAAARAFFQMASGQPAAAAAATAPPAPRPAVQAAAAPLREVPRAQRLPDANAPQPARVLRPGSLLDIRV